MQNLNSIPLNAARYQRAANIYADMAAEYHAAGKWALYREVEAERARMQAEADLHKAALLVR